MSTSALTIVAPTYTLSSSALTTNDVSSILAKILDILDTLTLYVELTSFLVIIVDNTRGFPISLHKYDELISYIFFKYMVITNPSTYVDFIQNNVLC